MIARKEPAPFDDSAIPVRRSAPYFPGRPSMNTIYRWVAKGVQGVRLETFVVGGRRFVSIDAIQRFIAESTAARSADGAGTVSAPKVSRDRQREIQAAERELDEAGV